jgi:DNA-binding NarL/FixJ family response regulator
MTSSDTKISVLLADGHSLFREAARCALSAQSELAVVAVAGDGIAALNAARIRRPNVAILDAHLPKSTSLWTSIRIGKDFCSCGIIVLDSQEDERRLMRAMEVGAMGFLAMGYLAKTSPLSDLIEAIRFVQRGCSVVPNNMLGGLISGLLQRNSAHSHAMLKVVSRLPKRERELLALLVRKPHTDTQSERACDGSYRHPEHSQQSLHALTVQTSKFVTINRILDELNEASM